MPKIPELREAEAALERASWASLPLCAEVDRLREELAAAEARLIQATASQEAALRSARHLQARHLTDWSAAEGSALSLTRHVLRQTGPSDACWDRRAWLRMMVQAMPDGRKDVRAWTLSFSGPDGGQSDSRLDEMGPWVEDPCVALAVEAADRRLEAAGFVLTTWINS